MTTKRAPKPTAPTGTVTVTVLEPFEVYHDGQKRSGTLIAVPAETATYWAKHGWATINDHAAGTPA